MNALIQLPTTITITITILRAVDVIPMNIINKAICNS
jgi:hypothetical protein